VTKLQQQVYEYLMTHFEFNQRFPTYEELQEAFDFSSKSQAQNMMNRLKEKNLVTWQPGRPGTVQLIGYQARLEKIHD
jgi:SOS-response transcriptional repressor LexA